MSKEADRAILAALMGNGNRPVKATPQGIEQVGDRLRIPRGEEERDQIPVTKLATAPMDTHLSASRVVATTAKTAVEKRLEERAYEKPKQRKPKRDWYMQEVYDEAHGTSNGYDERIEDALAMRRREAGDY